MDHTEELRRLLFNGANKFKKQSNCSFKKSKKSIEKKQFHTIKKLKPFKVIAIFQTDKSNRLSIHNRKDYFNKVPDCIKTMKCKIVKHNPLSEICTKTKEINEKGICSDFLNVNLKLNNFVVIPRLVSRLKDHKQDCPLRSIIIKCQIHSYYLEREYIPLLKRLLLPSKFTANSTVDVIS